MVSEKTKENLILLGFAIVAIVVAIIFLFMPIQSHPDTEQHILKIQVSERFPQNHLDSAYIITKDNVIYDLTFSNDMFMDLKPGSNYTILVQKYVLKNLNAYNRNGTIIKIISKDD